MSLHQLPNSTATTPRRTVVNVPAMSIRARVEESLQRSIPLMPVAVRDLVKALTSPRALTEIVITLDVWAASHLIGIGEIADFIMLLAAPMMLAKTALDASKELLAFGSLIVQARDSTDLDIAAQHFAKAVVLVGVATVSAILLRRATAIRSSESVAVQTEGTALKAMNETPYTRAVKGLDLKLSKGSLPMFGGSRGSGR